MRPLPFLAIWVLAAPVLAHDEDIPINTASELRDWCRIESEAKLVSSGKTPYNWTAFHTEQGNVFKVEGKWQVSGKDVNIICRAARGARRHYATMEIKSTE